MTRLIEVILRAQKYIAPHARDDGVINNKWSGLWNGEFYLDGKAFGSERTGRRITGDYALI